MKNLCTGLLLMTMFIFISCQNEGVGPVHNSDSDITLRGGKPNDNGTAKGNGNGKGGKDDSGDMDDTGDEEPVLEYGVTYQILDMDDYDPLFRFSFTIDGNLVLFQTDSTVTDWGTDYWGYWDEPYPFEDGVVQYISGLSLVTYEFEPIGEGLYDVTRTLIQGSYNSSHTTTTITHPGVYAILE